jgi:hypothetical protein
LERQIKDTRHIPHYCPDCQPQRSAARRAARLQVPAASTKENAMAAHPDITTHPDPAAALAYDDVTRIVAAQYSAGVPLDEIYRHYQEVSCDLLDRAQTQPGRAYAREFTVTGGILIGDLVEDDKVAQGRSAAACAQPEGTPHPDPFLANRGWQADRGIWQRTGQGRQRDREAG